ncbi:MAG: outer membrane protein transport protein [Xanthomonadales bacterium]|nr:outer membrane protein transport protein [Xanthomonadales bacterium]
MLCCGTAMATDGYFQHGYGIQAKGRGGTAMAIATDAFGGANNPATMVMAGSRLDLDLDAFSPRRSAERSGLGPGLDGSVDSGRTWFGIPELGYSHMLQDNLALGISLYGNGGMNTDYPGGQFNCGQGPANILCGNTSIGVDLTQLIIAPTAAYAITPNQSIGIAPQIALQRFAAKGLQAFASTPGLSSAPGSVTNNGAEMSSGVGVRFGYFARISPAFSFGAAYSSKIGMSRFKDYAGLFAQAGKFDIPENYSLGVAWNATAALTLSADYERINYSGVQSVSNPSLVQAQLGASGGPGFGWHDVDVWKLGAEYASSDRWSWRAGYNHGSNPIRGSDVTFNILAPGVVTDHVTLGLTRTTASGGAWIFAYMHAFKNTVEGASILPVFMGGAPAGNERISMYQNSFAIGYSWRL